MPLCCLCEWRRGGGIHTAAGFAFVKFPPVAAPVTVDVMLYDSMILREEEDV